MRWTSREGLTRVEQKGLKGGRKQVEPTLRLHFLNSMLRTIYNPATNCLGDLSLRGRDSELRVCRV